MIEQLSVPPFGELLAIISYGFRLEDLIVENIFNEILTAKPFPTTKKDGTDIRLLVKLRKEMNLKKGAKIPFNKFTNYCSSKGLPVIFAVYLVLYLRQIGELSE